jgi:ribosomal protein S18 acetylase RimI-like enzyme
MLLRRGCLVMANFYISLPADEIARQVAGLLNNYNYLKRKMTGWSILNSPATYFTEIYGDKVVGCSAILRETETVTLQFHLCVDPAWRRRGIARKLKQLSMSYVETPFVYVTIREDNAASIALSLSEGFILIRKNWTGAYNVLVLAKDLRKSMEAIK